jgi:periplasmic protein CpxP/Spy
MTDITRRVTLALGAGLVALGIAAGVKASVQNTNQDLGTFSAGQGGRGWGGRGGMMGPMGPDGALGMLRMLGPELQLTDAQKQQLKSIVDAHRDEWKALADRSRAAHEALTAAITADTVDEALIRSKSAEAGTVEADIAVAAARARAEAWQILTPEQREKAKQLRAQAHDRMRDGRRGRGR